jgi:hypothetical protein
MRRRALLWLAGLALVALALLLTDRLLWQPGLTEDNVWLDAQAGCWIRSWSRSGKKCAQDGGAAFVRQILILTDADPDFLKTQPKKRKKGEQ